MKDVSLSNMLLANNVGSSTGVKQYGVEKRASESNFDKSMARAQKNRMEQRNTVKTASNKSSKRDTATQGNLENNGVSTAEMNVTNKETKKVSEEVKQGDAKVERVEEVANTSQTPKIDPAIVMIAEILQMPVAQVEEALAQISLTVPELLDEGNMSMFLSALYGEDTLSLLENRAVVEQVSKLWNMLEEYQGETVDTNLQLADTLVDTTKDLVAAKSLVAGEVQEKMAEPVATLAGVKEIASQSEEVATTIAPSHIAQGNVINKTTENNVFLEQTVGESQAMGADIGMNVFLQAGIRDLQQAAGHGNVTTMEKAQGTGNTFSLPTLEEGEVITLKDGKEIEMQLYPKELGKLTLKVVEHSGVVVTQIKVETEKTKQLLLENIEALKASLEKQGLTIGSLEVDVRENFHQSQMEQQKQKSSKRIQEILKNTLETEQDEVAEKAVTSILETQVDYMA